MKPLFRWTIGGNPHVYGLHALEKSIISVLKLYKEEFDYVLCYNGLLDEQIDYIKHLNIDIFEQVHCKEMEYTPLGNAYKLYPPRLREQTNELFMDNDIILHSRSNIVDEFLTSSNMTFITEGYGNYGKYKNNLTKAVVHANSGFFGIPPYFPFAQMIKNYQRDDTNRQWEDRFDEQGIVASCLLNHSKNKVIPFSDIKICETNYSPTAIGSHFVRINAGNIDPWNQYLNEFTYFL